MLCVLSVKILLQKWFNGHVHCFSMQVVGLISVFSTLKKKLAQIRLVVFKKILHFNSKK